MLVVEQQLRAQVFDSLGIDYCCHGNQTLAQACTNKSLDATSVLDLIDKCDQAAISNKATHTWLDATITELTHHIQNTHHAYLKSELPQLVSLANKVAKVHGGKEQRLLQLNKILVDFKNEIDKHTLKEDTILFPYICKLDQSTTAIESPFGTVANPIHCMEAEHENAGDALFKFRELTNHYSAPAEACNSWRALLSGLENLDKDLRIHILIENSILFPRAIAKENEAATSREQSHKSKDS